jgi:hypothetical protein
MVVDEERKRERIREYSRQYYLRNRERLIAKTQEYKASHEEWYRTYMREYQRKQLAADPVGVRKKRLLAMRKWKRLNAEKWKAMQRGNRKKHYWKNRDKILAQRRQATKRKAWQKTQNK